jgi:hypothetical protein
MEISMVRWSFAGGGVVKVLADGGVVAVPDAGPEPVVGCEVDDADGEAAVDVVAPAPGSPPQAASSRARPSPTA